MASPARTKKQREYDLAEISNLYLQGWIQAAIADHIAKSRPYKITQQTISRDLKTIQERWQASAIRSFDEARARELAAIDNLERVAWEAYQAKEPPDPRFLDRVSWCIDRRVKLLGLDAPTKNEISGKDGGPIIISELTDEQLKRLAAGEDIQVSE